MTFIDRSKQTSGVAKIHRVTVAAGGQSASLVLPSPTRHVVVTAIGAAARLYTSAADEVAGVRYHEVPAGTTAEFPVRIGTLVVQGQAAGTICVTTTHDALDVSDAVGEDYVAA